MSYNLSDNVNDDFEFEIKGVHYKMRYPLVEEIEEMQTLVDENKDVDGKENKDQLTKLQEVMYSFISPVDEKSPAIVDMLKKQNVRVLQNFNTMVKTELGIN